MRVHRVTDLSQDLRVKNMHLAMIPIKLQKGKTREETIKIAKQVKAAAFAPSDPSPQDLKVAQNAEATAAKAKQEKSDIYA